MWQECCRPSPPHSRSCPRCFLSICVFARLLRAERSKANLPTGRSLASLALSFFVAVGISLACCFFCLFQNSFSSPTSQPPPLFSLFLLLLWRNLPKEERCCCTLSLRRKGKTSRQRTLMQLVWRWQLQPAMDEHFCPTHTPQTSQVELWRRPPSPVCCTDIGGAAQDSRAGPFLLTDRRLWCSLGVRRLRPRLRLGLRLHPSFLWWAFSRESSRRSRDKTRSQFALYLPYGSAARKYEEYVRTQATPDSR